MTGLLLGVGAALLAFGGPIWYWQVVSTEQKHEPRTDVVAVGAALIGLGVGLVGAAVT